MLEIILQILSVAGIVLLVLLALLAAALLLVLFFPVSYRILGSRDGEGFRASVRVRWLLGLLRAQYAYPETGHAVVKVLCFTLFDKKIPSGEDADGEDADGAGDGGGPGGAGEDGGTAGEDGADGTVAREDSQEPGSAAPETASSESASIEAENHPPGKISQKFQKLKYTISGIYDKIKKIWENISYYIGLMQEEETRQLFSHIFFRTGRILRSIRPRHLRADIVFGTGAPDTTGYLYGVYCMLSGGPGRGVSLVPDFGEAVFRGEFEAEGRITLWVLVHSGVCLLLDRKLRRFLKKAKAGK